MTLLIRCNQDFTILVLTEAGLIHYVCSYVTKDQMSIEFIADAYASAIATRIKAEENTEPQESDLNQRVANRLRGVIHNITGKAQVSAPLAASKLLGHPTPARSSELFANLYLIQLTKGIEDKPINSRLSTNADGTVTVSSFYSNYTLRPVGQHSTPNISNALYLNTIDFDSMGSLYYVRHFEVISKKDAAPKPAFAEGDNVNTKGKRKKKKKERGADYDPELSDFELNDNDSDDSSDEDVDGPTADTSRSNGIISFPFHHQFFHISHIRS